MNSLLIPALFLKDEKLVSDFSNYNVLSDNPVDYSVSLAAKGANKIIIFDLSNTDSEKQLRKTRTSLQINIYVYRLFLFLQGKRT